MDTTSLTLLESLRNGGMAAPEWARFVRLYEPLMKRWAVGCGFAPADADDLAQEVLVRLFSALPKYRRTDDGSFRTWLFVLARHAGIDYRRRVATRKLPAPDGLSGVDEGSPLAEMEEAEYLRELSRQAVELIRAEFSPQAMASFVGTKIDGKPAAEVAAALGVTANAVYIAVNKVMTRLREVLAGLTD